MRRKPSVKQQFIKDYAKVVYGPQGNSKSLTAQERAMIKQLFEHYPDSEVNYLGYVRWLARNAKRICQYFEDKRDKLSNFDTSKPGPFLLVPSFFHQYYNYFLIEKGADLPPLGRT